MQTYTTDGRRYGKKAAQTRAALVETAKVLMNRYPIHNLSVIDITREAKVASGTFYQYFNHLDTLIEELAEAVSPIEAGRQLWERQAVAARQAIVESRAIARSR